MESVAAGDEGALATLVDRHGPRLHAFLVRLIQDQTEAEDLVQETWVRIARSANSFNPSRRFRPWVYGIALNLARDLHRKRRVRSRAPVDPPAPRTDTSPLERLDLRGRLARLPDQLREVLMLRYYEGMNEAEMAEALGVPRGTVKSRLHAAVRALKLGYGEQS